MIVATPKSLRVLPGAVLGLAITIPSFTTTLSGACVALGCGYWQLAAVLGAMTLASVALLCGLCVTALLVIAAERLQSLAEGTGPPDGVASNHANLPEDSTEST